MLACVRAENELLREALRRYETDILAISSSMLNGVGGVANSYPTAASSHGGGHPPWNGTHLNSVQAQAGAHRNNPYHWMAGGGGQPVPVSVGGGAGGVGPVGGGAGTVAAVGGTAVGAVGTSAHFNYSSQLAAAAARLSACSAHLSSLAAKAALQPLHTTYKMLHEE